MHKVEKTRILNIEIHNWKINDFLENLTEGIVLTPNVDHLIRLQKDEDFYKIYSQAEHIVCDSRVVQFLSFILYPGNGIKEQIAGSDLFPAFYHFHKENTENIKIFLLGGTENSIIKAQNNINKKVKEKIIVGTYSPPFGFEKDREETKKIIELVYCSKATVLAVGVGAPKQEKWIFENRNSFKKIKIFFAIGATINFEAKTVKRTPYLMKKFGMEWLFRITQEPGRLLRRYIIDDLPIFWLIFKQKTGIYKNPWSTK